MRMYCSRIALFPFDWLFENGYSCAVWSVTCQGRGGMDGPVFFLPGSIEHVKKRHFVVDYALLAIRIFDGLAGGASVRENRESRALD